MPRAKIARLLQDLQLETPDDLDELLTTSRFSMGRACDDLYRKVCVVEQLQLTDCVFDWPCVSLSALLQHVTREETMFKHLLRQLWSSRPCSQAQPYGLTLYCDEIVPGNVLAPDNARKMACWYITVTDFGPQVVRHESIWLPLAVLRSSIAKKLAGGVSCCLAVIMRRLMISEELSTKGICLDIGAEGGGHAQLFFRLSNVVADADGHRALWCVSGAAGKLPCPMCLNVVNDDVPGTVHMRCPDVARFQLARDTDWWNKAGRLTAASAGTKKHLSDLQTAMGLRFAPTGVLWDLALRPFVSPTSSFTYDGMHILLSNGLCQTEVDLILQRAVLEGLDMSSVEAYIRLPWSFCQAYGQHSTLLGCVSAARLRSFKRGGELKCGASEMLMLMPVLCLFFRTIVAQSGKLLPEIECLEQLCTVVELYRKGKDGQDVADLLEQAVEKHGQLFLAVYDQEPRPKAHYAHHLAKHLRRDGYIIDCFTGERKHQIVKMMAREVRNLNCFEKSVLVPTLAKTLVDAETLREGLRNPAECPADLCQSFGIANGQVAKSMRRKGITLTSADLVEVDGRWYRASLFVESGTRFGMVGDVMELRQQVTPFAWRMREKGEMELVEICEGSRVRLASSWMGEQSGDIVAIL
jgi:hypothetical protein